MNENYRKLNFGSNLSVNEKSGISVFTSVRARTPICVRGKNMRTQPLIVWWA